MKLHEMCGGGGEYKGDGRRTDAAAMSVFFCSDSLEYEFGCVLVRSVQNNSTRKREVQDRLTAAKGFC
jgi:hypothetical protein